MITSLWKTEALPPLQPQRITHFLTFSRRAEMQLKISASVLFIQINAGKLFYANFYDNFLLNFKVFFYIFLEQSRLFSSTVSSWL